MQIPLRIFDSNYKLLGEIDQYESMSLTRRLIGCGDLHMAINAKLHCADLLKPGCIVYIDGHRAAFIEYVETELVAQGDACERLTITGRTLEHLLNRRITVPMPESMPQKAESLIKNLVSYNLGSKAVGNRRVNNFIIKSTRHAGDDISWEFGYKNLADEVQKICEKTGLGIEVEFNAADRTFVFDVVEGKNRCIGQSGVPPVILAVEYDNVISQIHIESLIDMKNTALAGGAGEGAEQMVHWVFGNNAGVARREMFVENRLLETDAEIIEHGNSALTETEAIQSLDCKINPNSNLKYGRDFFLGDLVTLKWHDMVLTKRVCEVTESFEQGSHTISCVFGKKSMDLIDKLKHL